MVKRAIVYICNLANININMCVSLTTIVLEAVMVSKRCITSEQSSLQKFIHQKSREYRCFSLSVEMNNAVARVVTDRQTHRHSDTQSHRHTDKHTQASTLPLRCMCAKGY